MTWTTWGEFKKAVKKLGVEDNHEILYIDVHSSEHLEVKFESMNTKTFVPIKSIISL